jgi:hypothetical protein
MDEIGMVWNTYDAKWEENFLALVAYLRRVGSFPTSKDYVHRSLYDWCSDQRRTLGEIANGNAAGKATQEARVAKLNGIGFIW